MKVRGIVFHQHGAPAEVAHCEEIELPPLGDGDIEARVLLAPINPADLNTIEGTYAARPPLPAVPGGEGVGVVERVGAEVSIVTPGVRVLFPAGLGTWRERVVADAEAVIVVPEDIPLEKAAMLRVNPATAYRMLHDFVDLQPGDWIIQNAANSAVGRAVIEIAAAKGWRTINLVRRAEVGEELRAIKADVVLVDNGDLSDQIKAATGGEPVRLALNAVGGESAGREAKALTAGGTLVTYGGMSRQPVRVPTSLLIFSDLRFRGFWVTRWYREASSAEQDEMFQELFSLARAGLFDAPIEKVYPLEEATAALRRAGEGSRGGKILFSPSAAL